MDEAKLPLTAHLGELRNRIIKLLLAWAATSAASWTYHEEIFAFLMRPALKALAPDGGRLQAIAPGEIFFTYMKCALLAGFVLALPVIFWQIWGFVSPGLYPQEKRVALPFVVVSTLLFVAGAAFGYVAVFPAMFTFFAHFESSIVESAWRMSEVFHFSTQMFLAFGVSFELPVVVFFLSLSGIVDARQLLRGFKYAVLVAFIVAAILTPTPDVVTQTLLAGPLCVLYLLGVGVAWLFGRKRAAQGQETPGSEITPA